MAATHTVDLYGGAMRISLPQTMIDVSDFRQVPDNQEVYTDADTGASVIVELLRRQTHVCNFEAGAFFYHDLAKDNGCAPESISQEETCTLPPSAFPLLATSAAPAAPADCGPVAPQSCDFACLTTGLQRISKYTNEKGKENEVFVGLAVLRFTPPVSTEILVSVSCPTWLHPESSEARVVKRLLTEQERLQLLYTAVASLEVVEWGLFVPEEE
ncbi:putative Ran-binding protein [Leishmania infantum JPCM5]|uniref:Ran-binding_protein_-_putative n=2 Tax=Leishmania infantum TaxID=5671 RepID=A0A6L0XQ88_LEIIN|nr:putative Ran-binding protein [Leishmania infantum JPCM5]CAC9490167.1 Ran-binding_protein_-_putative [Leishmania infantum]CAM68269.1 putative Ran-binding protein [Leishmania infantum JPCM5]SUZ42046.1 Ran-binding_protein_-_putative [Leishmania infantum]|eukprot:XP_001465840.1 putative Ran-binding protein [Leishmania infantum JPCM5]